MNTSTSITSTRSLAHIALFAAVIAALGLVPKIDMPLGVPITLQSLGVMLAGCLLGPRRGFLSLLLFLTAVALGLPLLSSGRGGLAVFTTPAAGFLLGWLLGAGVCGWCMRRMARARGRALLAAAFVAALVGGIGMVYLCGIVGLMLSAHLSWNQAILAVLIFLPGDLLKCAICAVLVQSVVRGMPGWRLERD